MRRRTLAVSGLAVLSAASLLAPASLRSASPAAPPAPDRTLMLATTTSVDATGLLDKVADAFRAETGIVLKWVALGTGAAIKQAVDGNVDAVIVHAKPLEDEFLRSGGGVNRRVVARNFFLLVGPPADPAGVVGSPDVKTAMERIKAAGAPFASRADKSGTHLKELELWKLAGGVPASNYIEVGQGMAQTLRVAAERQAYTLTDGATFDGIAGLSGLKPIFESAPELENIYAAIAVNPARIPTAKYADAMALIAYLTSPQGQALVGSLQGKSGRGLFEPMAGVPGVDLLK